MKGKRRIIFSKLCDVQPIELKLGKAFIIRITCVLYYDLISLEVSHFIELP